MKALIKDYNVGFTMALIEEKTVKNTLGIFGVPCYVLLDKKGTIAGIYRYRTFSETNFKPIETLIKTLLQSNHSLNLGRSKQLAAHCLIVVSITASAGMPGFRVISGLGTVTLIR